MLPIGSRRGLKTPPDTARRAVYMGWDAAHGARCCCMYGMRINGARAGIVPAWRLTDYLRGIQVLNARSAIEGLADGEMLIMAVRVHGQRLELSITASTWCVYLS